MPPSAQASGWVSSPLDAQSPGSAPPPTLATHAAGAATPPKPREIAAGERTPAPDYPGWGVGGSRGPWVEGRAHTHLVVHGRAHRPPSCSRLEVQAAPRQARASIKGFVVPAPPARGPGLGVPQPTAGSRLTEPSPQRTRALITNPGRGRLHLGRMPKPTYGEIHMQWDEGL
ncbi:formin-like protein 20 [Oryx dammah]|uniref:formin-like protein 20 n=1 Tax=Oryx dammah TaxID=59534 RepID=UPI001A9B01BA|nr:formin-like protein 20 [Oryx dammah]